FILAVSLVFWIGLAFVFTPLFPSSLGSIKPELYSHGSAVLGSTQQVAGAAGVGPFVSLMSVQTAALVGGGASAVDALSGGIRIALMVGATISMFAIVTAF